MQGTVLHNMHSPVILTAMFWGNTPVILILPSGRWKLGDSVNLSMIIQQANGPGWSWTWGCLTQVPIAWSLCTLVISLSVVNHSSVTSSGLLKFWLSTKEIYLKPSFSCQKRSWKTNTATEHFKEHVVHEML